MTIQMRWCFVGPDGRRRDNFIRMVRRARHTLAERGTESETMPWAASGIDAVYLSVPFEDRAAIVDHLIRDGKPVLVEGPITADPVIANRVRDLSILNAVPVMETPSFRHHPQHRLVAGLIRSGAIGEVKEIRAQVSSPLLACGDDEYEPGWYDAWTAGATVIGAVRSLLGSEPTSAVGWSEEDEEGAEHGFSGIFRFEDNVSASVAWSERAGYGAGYTIVGSSATIEAPQAFLPYSSEFGAQRVVIRDGMLGKRVEQHFSPVDNDVLMLGVFADLLRHPSACAHELDDIVATCVAMALMRSAARRPAPRQGGRQWNLSRSA